MQSHIEVAQGDIFMENEIWAGFGLIGNTEKKKLGTDYEQLLRVFFFMILGAKK